MREVAVSQLKERMVLAEDIFLKNQNVKLLAKGHEMTASIVEYLQNLDKNVEVRQPIKIIEPLIVF